MQKLPDLYTNKFQRKNDLKKNKVIEWSDEFKEAFRELKEICTTPPILAYADFSKPFKLHTVSCTLGLGAILYQNQNEVDWGIGYASRFLSKTEHKYLAHKLEFLALKWAITEQFYEYLYGNHFAIYTDNNPLIYVLTSTKLDALGHHWVAGLAYYNFALNYHLGKINVDADALSHNPKGEYGQCIEADSVCALIYQTVQGTTLMEAYSCNVWVTENLDMEKDPKAMPVKDWVITWTKYPAIREIKYLINNKRLKGEEGVLAGCTNYQTIVKAA